MPTIAACPCGRTFSADDDWVGDALTCPACGTLTLMPGNARPSRMAWACLASGTLAVFLLAFGFMLGISDGLDRVMPRTFSRLVEQRRIEKVGYASMVASLLAFAAAILAGKSPSDVRRSGFLSPSDVRRSGLALAGVSLLSTLLLPAYAGARSAARRAQCTNNLKQIALAMASYETAHGAYPPRAIRGREGRPLLSWRVALLPHLEMQDLYEKFHLDEPWDSPHNLPLADLIPAIYVCPSQSLRSQDLALYQVLDGPGVFLDGSRPTTAAEIVDDPARTIAVVEGTAPVPWSSPQDMPFDPARPFPAWEVTHAGGFNASFADGSVKFLPRTMPESELKDSATRDGKVRPAIASGFVDPGRP